MRRRVFSYSSFVHLAMAMLFAIALSAARAQQADDSLTYTLENGRTIHFQTAEQKEKFLAARARVKQTASTPAPSAQPMNSPVLSTTHPSSDAKSSGEGTVNSGAPRFTAAYYLLAPDTWVGKQLTLSVAYITSSEAASRKDGLILLTAYTWGNSPNSIEQNSGGTITILATPAAAKRITTLCGGSLQYTAAGYKMSLIRGEMTVLDPSTSGHKQYALLVNQ